MNGAESLVRTLLDSQIDLCFTNPGTSEMHFVAALDKLPGMRCVLGLFEGVVTGAADGFYRMADRPAATLLHLGPGLANGLANLHNAKKAGSGIVNIVGEHATFHLRHDAPLTADIEALARPMSHWVKTVASAKDVAGDGALAVEAARTAPGQIATLVLPADAAWNEASGPVRARAAAPRATVSSEAVQAAAVALRRPGPKALLLGGAGVREDALLWAGRIAAKTDCTLLGEFNSPRTQRGAGRVAVQRVPYVVTSCWPAPSRRWAFLPTRGSPACWRPRPVPSARWRRCRKTSWLRSRRWPTPWARAPWRHRKWPNWRRRRCPRGR
jgi:acetolactate synthase-1/2/3 large subunit